MTRTMRAQKTPVRPGVQLTATSTAINNNCTDMIAFCLLAFNERASNGKTSRRI